MALTRANAEVILIRRVGALLTAADLDGTTVDGTNVDLNDPFASALRQLGHTVSSAVLVADADLASLAAADYNAFFDLAELRTKKNVLGNLTLVDITAGPRSERLGQLAEQLRKDIDALQDAIKADYNIGVGTLEAGIITLDFAEKDE